MQRLDNLYEPRDRYRNAAVAGGIFFQPLASCVGVFYRSELVGRSANVAALSALVA